MAWWEGGEILGGRDEVAGGTWLACTRGGKVAILTNVLELHTLPEAKSRGELPVRFLEVVRSWPISICLVYLIDKCKLMLQSKKSPKEFAEEVVKEAHLYNGFNLIMAHLSSNTMVYISNMPKGEPIVIQDVPPGTHVLSTAKLDSPWPQVSIYIYILKRERESQLTCYKSILIPFRRSVWCWDLEKCLMNMLQVKFQ